MLRMHRLQNTWLDTRSEEEGLKGKTATDNAVSRVGERSARGDR